MFAKLPQQKDKPRTSAVTFRNVVAMPEALSEHVACIQAFSRRAFAYDSGEQGGSPRPVDHVLMPTEM
jgi:hypothetical protein